LNRIQAMPATGQPTRYKEQTMIPTNDIFVDPRSGVSGGDFALSSINSNYGRVEQSALLRAQVSGINYTVFDKQLVEQQGGEEFLLAKDMNDMLYDMYRVQNQAIWTGNAANLSDSTKVQYCGLLTQITNTVNVANPWTIGCNPETTVIQYITDAIRTKVAAQKSSLVWASFPTALYANPLTIDYINQSETARVGNFRPLNEGTMVIENGFEVDSVRTMAGKLPLIPDPYIPVTLDSGTGKYKHTIVAVNERLIERHYIKSPVPQVFKMSLTTNLMDNYVAVMFDTIIAKGAGTAQPHFTVTFEI